MSRKNRPGGVGVGAARSNCMRPAVADGLTVNVSPAVGEPLTSIVSVPASPSLMSSSSPPFQTIVSLPPDHR